MFVKPASVILTVKAQWGFRRVYGSNLNPERGEVTWALYAADENIKCSPQLPRPLLSNGVSTVHGKFIYHHQINKSSSRAAQILTTWRQVFLVNIYINKYYLLRMKYLAHLIKNDDIKQFYILNIIVMTLLDWLNL